MMTVEQAKAMHSHSLLTSRYILHEMRRHYNNAYSFWKDTTGKDLHAVRGSAWISALTGQLCLNIGDGDKPCVLVWVLLQELKDAPAGNLPSIQLTLPAHAMEEALFGNLTHDDLFSMFKFQHGQCSIESGSSSIAFPSIWDFSSGGHRLATNQLPNRLSNSDFAVMMWRLAGSETSLKRTSTGWTGIEFSSTRTQPYYKLKMSVELENRAAEVAKNWWLSQAYAFLGQMQRAGTAETFMNLHLVTGVRFECLVYSEFDPFTLHGTFMADPTYQPVYLFLFTPQVEMCKDHFTLANPPDTEKYYWARDPEGFDRLTHEVADDLGLPMPYFEVDLQGVSVTEEESKLIHKFHIAKEVDPNVVVPAVWGDEEYADQVRSSNTVNDIAMPGGWPEVAEY
ncbi:hypothetical protein FB45DRAFT_82902 [Roridomyces roridus]|uniref:Uncharacterized protein n=1 Tax=Roridomyces roridus TaxID=1738132 RepID=A0AAD7FHA5_9AGAR|nr:hypothetical protein FB45DRAFT_82902 [Roridomyces roridus]